MTKHKGKVKTALAAKRNPWIKSKSKPASRRRKRR